MKKKVGRSKSAIAIITRQRPRHSVGISRATFLKAVSHLIMRFIGVSETRLLLAEKLINTTRAREKSFKKKYAERLYGRDIGND